MAELNEFTSGGSSVIATGLLQALQRLVIAANSAELRRNRDNLNNQTNFVNYTITADAQTTFAATVTVPSRMVEDELTGEVTLKVEDTFNQSYFPFTPGVGDLSSCDSGMEAIVKLARKCTYREKLIDPNVVVTRADQIILTTDIENGQYIVALNLPIDVSTDELTGVTAFDPFDYLRILQFQAA
jgi:hypothetical protein